MNGTIGILDVGDEGGGDAAGVGEHGHGVGDEGRGGERGERGGVGEPRRGGDPQPLPDHHEHSRVVQVRDRGEHGEDRERDVAGLGTHPSHLAPPSDPGSRVSIVAWRWRWRRRGRSGQEGSGWV